MGHLRKASILVVYTLNRFLKIGGHKNDDAGGQQGARTA